MRAARFPVAGLLLVGLLGGAKGLPIEEEEEELGLCKSKTRTSNVHYGSAAAHRHVDRLFRFTCWQLQIILPQSRSENLMRLERGKLATPIN